MIQYVVMLYRRSDLSQEEFEEVWLGEHLTLARGLPGIIAAEFLPRLQQGEDDPGPHGVGRLVFDNPESLAEALRTVEAAVLREHTSTFAQSDRAVRMIAREL